MKISARTGATVMTEGGPVSANSTASSTDAQGQVTEWQRAQTTTEPADAQVAGSAGVSQPAAVAAAEPHPGTDRGTGPGAGTRDRRSRRADAETGRFSGTGGHQRRAGRAA